MFWVIEMNMAAEEKIRINQEKKFTGYFVVLTYLASKQQQQPHHHQLHIQLPVGHLVQFLCLVHQFSFHKYTNLTTNQHTIMREYRFDHEHEKIPRSRDKHIHQKVCNDDQCSMLFVFELMAK